MNHMSFVCDAIYRGSEIVEGAVSPNKLTSLAELVLNTEQPIKGYAEICIDKLPRGERCQLQIDEERLRVSTSRKDEGFESDSESSTASGSVGEENLCASPEIKVIKDHVLRLEKLIRQDSGIHHCASKATDDGGSTSLSSSSGAESEEDAPKRHQQTFDSNPQTKNQNEKPSTSEKAFQIENGNGDNFLLSDILFCHVMSHRPKVVIVVVKSLDTHIVAAHLFECLSPEAARTLYNCYYTASNKYKLNRYRINKRRNEGIAADKKAVLDRIHVSIRNIRRKNFEASAKIENNFQSELSKSHVSFNHGEISDSNIKHNYKTNMKGNPSNVNVIEIKDVQFPLKVPNGMMQKIDENGVTHIEIESAPCSLNNQLGLVTNSHLKTTFDSQEVLSALDRLSIHSSNNPDSYLNYVGVTSSCPNSLIVTSREIHAAGEREKDRKLRQRQPPLLIKKEAFRKVDSLPRKEIRKRGEKNNRSRSDERKSGQNEAKQNTLLDGAKEQNEDFLNSYDVFDGAGRQRFMEIITKDELRSGYESDTKGSERQSRLRTPARPKDDSKNRPRSNHNKGPAPPPPPRKHPNNPSLMLVPTKSGQENTRAYYPKESHIVRGSKLVRIDYPLYPPWNMNSDMNNNAKRVYYAHPSWMSSHEYHTNRYSDNSISGDIRKRSRSKSPARRPMAHRYIDVVSTFNLSQKLKDLSDTVIQSWKNTSNLSGSAPSLNINKDSQERVMGRREKKQSTASSSSSKSKSDDALRPVIKRGKKVDSSADARRVTFNAYATVQVMDS